MTRVPTNVVMELRDVHKWYTRRGVAGWYASSNEERKVRALNGVSIQLEKGRVLGVAGESGSGKSTLANIAVGLEQPARGEIRFQDEDVREFRNSTFKHFRRNVQMIFQDPFSSLNPRFTIGRTIEEPLIIHKLGDRASRVKRTVEALEEAELRPANAFMDKFPHELSGGQRQRAAIARAIVLRPAVLIADEPVSMLDVSIRAGILRLLGQLVERSGMSMMFITHDLSLISHICDDLAIIYRGHIVETGAALELLAAPLHPYTKQLIASVPVLDSSRRAEPPALPIDSVSQASPTDGCVFRPRCHYAVDACAKTVPHLRSLTKLRYAACHQSENLALEAASVTR